MSNLRSLASAVPPKSVEVLQEEIGARCSERQHLRTAGAGDGELEENRLEIARLQQELSRALIWRFAPPAAA